MDNMGWEFLVNSIKRRRFLLLMNREMKAGNIAYMFPKRILKKMHSNTPLKFLSNSRQLPNFIAFSKTNVIRLCFSLTANHGRHEASGNQKHVVIENVAVDFDSFGNVQQKTMKPS
ncbi:hypothetical protein N665_0953s0003 [Sinapis alba]|nr:hypothetical protein N665_0953s0003 [Sinapis alba]